MLLLGGAEVIRRLHVIPGIHQDEQTQHRAEDFPHARTEARPDEVILMAVTAARLCRAAEVVAAAK